MPSIALNIAIASQVWARGMAKRDIPMSMLSSMVTIFLQQWPEIVLKKLK